MWIPTIQPSRYLRRKPIRRPRRQLNSNEINLVRHCPLKKKYLPIRIEDESGRKLEKSLKKI